MAFFSRFFRKKAAKNTTATKATTLPEIKISPECRVLLYTNAFMDSLLRENRYVSKKEYTATLLDAKQTVEFLIKLQRDGMLGAFCAQNGLSVQFCENALKKYGSFETLVDNHNEQFISRALSENKNYLDNILKQLDPNIVLDEEQRRAVLTDEDYCLIIAGAGAGKTTTVAARVKYLVEKQGVDPKQILVVSFTNKAVNELKQRINNDLNIACPIATFHSTGNAILHKQSQEMKTIVQPSKLYYVLQDYFKGSLLKNKNLVKNMIMFFASYFEEPYDGEDITEYLTKLANANFSTMRSDLDEFRTSVIDQRTKKNVTIQSEFTRSYQETEIANFLYLNNLDYEYEPTYKYNILLSKKPYTPDFIVRQGDNVVYIEHFGISQDGRNDRYSDWEIERYKKAINDKINLHKKHGTVLICTFSQYNDHRPLLEHLMDELQLAGFKLGERTNEEVIKKLISTEENRYIRKFLYLTCRFIENFKVNGYTAEDFDRMYASTENVRARLFLNICRECYFEYERYLRQNNAIDFADMINESARLLREAKELKQKLNFKYIIVDEYQDISRQRFDLTKALSEVTDAKITAVGDDWQSIYAFSGADIRLFTNFEEKMGYAKLLKITRTYRNSQEVIDIAGNFIQKNEAQITKALTSPKHIDDPVIIYTYDNSHKKPGANNKSGANYNLARAAETALEQIIDYNKKEGKPVNSSILLLGRYNFDGDMLEKTGLFEYDKRGNRLRSVKYPSLNLTFMTVHASKGLGYDNVIVLNGRNEMYGFPSKIEDDPVLSFVVREDRSITYAEERRLFYVAMTRTKNRVYFIAPEQNPSEFLLEIKRDYKNVRLSGDWNENPPESKFKKQSCPVCGYPMQLRYKPAFGLRLFICMNEPEICGFMTNEYKAGKLSIMKCDRCADGYLIVKPGTNNDYFLGCTNYKKDGTGCNRTISPKDYYKMMGIDPEPVPAKEFESGMSKPPKNKQAQDDAKQEKTSQEKESPQKQSEPDAAQTEYNAKQPDATPKGENVESREAEETAEELKKAGIQAVMLGDTNLKDIISTIVRCLFHMNESRYYSSAILIRVLRGSNDKRIMENSLDALPEYGTLKNLNREDLHTCILWLIKNDFILQTSNPKYPVLQLTYKGLHYDQFMTSNLLENLKRELQKSRVMSPDTQDATPQGENGENRKAEETAEELKKADIQTVMLGDTDLNDICHTVLLCLSHLCESRYYGVNVLINVLRGENDDRIKKNSLDTLPDYGALKNHGWEDLHTCILWLIENDFILQTKHPKYPVLHMTYKGLHYDQFMTSSLLEDLKKELQKSGNISLDIPIE